MSTKTETATTTDRQEDRTPVIQLWGRLVVPLQGDITDTQMERLTARVLEHIRERGADGLVLDVSGVWMVDSHLCAALARLAAAAQLMGVRSVLCGLSTDIVMTLLSLGFELRGVETSLGLEDALAQLGVRVERAQSAAQDMDLVPLG